MADETTGLDAAEINKQAEAIQDSLTDTGKAAEKTAKQIAEASKDIQKSFKATNKEIKDTGKSFETLKKKLSPTVKEMKKFTDSTEDAVKQSKLLDKSIMRAAVNGKKAVLSQLVVLKQYINTVKAASENVMELAQKLDEAQIAAEQMTSSIGDLNDQLVAANDQIADNEKSMEKLRVQFKQGKIDLGEFEDGVEQLEREQKGLKITVDAITKSIGDQKKALGSHMVQVEQSAKALHEAREEEFLAKQETIAHIKAQRLASAEQKIMNGGLEGFRGQLSKIMNLKFFEYLEKWSGPALLALGFKQLGDALKETSAMMNATAGNARTLGKEAKVGLGDLWSSAKQAQEATSALMYTSAELGMSFDKVAEAASRVRTSIRFDKEGQFSEKAIAGMTKAAAQFSKVAGVDMDTSVGMIEKRIKKFGMTSEEAVASINAMRVSLKQMMVGVKTEVIAMDDMVQLIEDASDASQAYVVDTRLLTQALRGAATQSANLGASQKQAKDVTQAIGKIFGDAPDFIKIPAGYDLLSQLTGDPDNFMEQFDENTRTQLAAIRDSLKKGEIDKYTAARAVMDATAGSEAGQEATMKRLSKTILGSSAAAEIIAETYGIENRATAFQLQKILKDTNKFQAALEKETGHKMSFASAMAKDVAVFDEMVKGMGMITSQEEKIAKLKEKGLSEEDAKAYLKAREDGAKIEKEAREKLEALKGDNSKEAAEKRAELEKQIYKATTLEQAKILDLALNPGKKLLADLNKELKGGKPINITTDLNAEKLKEAGFENAKELADKFGIKNKEFLNKLNEVYKGNATITAQQLEEMRVDESEANKKQIANINATATKFGDGFFTGMKHVSVTMLGDLGKWLNEKKLLDSKYIDAFGPVTTALLGLGAIVAGGYVIWKGSYAMIFKAVRDGVRSAGGLGGKNDPDIDLKSKKPQSRKVRAAKGGLAAAAIHLAMNSGDMYDAYKENKDKGTGETVKAVAKAADLYGLGGTVAGGAIGMALGGPVGALIGAQIGEMAGHALESYINSDETPEEGPSATAAASGAVTGAAMTAASLTGQPMPSVPESTKTAMMTSTGFPGGGVTPALKASAGGVAFNPANGKLTLEVANWGDVMASFKSASVA